MARFTKYNNPNKRKRKHYNHSSEYYHEQKQEMYALLATAKNDSERDLIIKSFNVSINS